MSSATRARVGTRAEGPVPWVVRVAALVGLTALLGACTGEVPTSVAGSGDASALPSSSAGPSPSEQPPAGSAMPSVRSVNSGSPELAGTGIRLVGVPTAGDGGYAWRDQIAADGAGMVWFLGPWQLIRLDPSSGDVTMWDAQDDQRFAAPEARLAEATGPGVWMLDGPRVRLFDGERFVVDEQLPTDMLDVPGGPPTEGFVFDLAQTRDALWVSVVDSAGLEEGGPDPRSGAQVVRFADDVWTVMSNAGDGVGGYLTVDPEGAVWDGGELRSDFLGSLDLGEGALVKRWDGSAWTSPGGETAPDQGGEVVADPTGGVWLLASGAWGVPGAERLRHFDGTTWRSVEDPLLEQMFSGGDWLPGRRDLAVDPQGRAWLFGQPGGETSGNGARVSHAGQVERLDGTLLIAIAAAGDRIVALDSEQALLWEGDAFAPATPRSATADWLFEPPLVHAVSEDEVWVVGQESWHRLRDGTWEDTRAGSDCLARTTDGALWTTAQDGSVGYPGGGRLFRTTSHDSRVITEKPVLCGYGAGTFAGSNGSVWVIQGDEVVQIWPDGRRTSIGRPERVDPDLDPEYDQDQVCLHGVDPAGAVWVTEYSDADDEECTAGTWHRWDGRRWRTAKGPDPFTSAREKVVSGEGIGWTLTGSQITRYSRGQDRVIAEEPGLSSLTAAPDGGACALTHPRDQFHATAILCFDARGQTARIDIAAMGVEDFSIAPDGAIWIVGPQVARLGLLADFT